MKAVFGNDVRSMTVRKGSSSFSIDVTRNDGSTDVVDFSTMSRDERSGSQRSEGVSLGLRQA